MDSVYTVTQVNSHIKNLISKDRSLSDILVKGEMSNFKHHYSGHMYFTIKDTSSIIKCVMFKSNAINLKFKPENGMQVIIKGYVSVFERDGQYQLYAVNMLPEGYGELYAAYEQLKERLEKEGLFDVISKKKLPFLPCSIGVVTSSTGAVIRDIIRVLKRRFENVSIKLYPAAVQGRNASCELAEGIKTFNKLSNVDVIILARGGGSIEDLWPFNEEIVARSIYESKIPVISAVGHETDFTISDFTADVRAATPSAAAEIAVPDKTELVLKIESLRGRLCKSLENTLNDNKKRYEALMNRPVMKNPYEMINLKRQEIDSLLSKIVSNYRIMYEQKKSALSKLAGRLEGISPLKTLLRGYCVLTKDSNGKESISSVNDINKDDIINARLYDGTLRLLVKDRNKKSIK